MSQAVADRNLLFGIIALQMDFIGREPLIAAMNAWVLEKHRPLADLLVERGALEPADRDALDAMIGRHVARHGDAGRSLAALSSTGVDAAELMLRVPDAEAQASLGHVGAGHRGDTIHTQHPDPDGSTATMPRYRRLRDHARGGLGVVYVAHDRELNREVALKEIQERHADDATSRGRFLLEAEITGGLEHPGIVPVYGLGRYADGRPFYAMRFIKGQSLKEAIGLFHARETARRDPGERELSLQKLLRRFLDVCDAVDYAHSRGVLHRDLKPNNIMVGRYGETLVVDWGLAKATGQSVGKDGASLPESTLLPSSASGAGETLPGSAVGTPGYMPPEQAAGRLDLLGPASDVYSLGATLYALLTDSAPFTGPDIAAVLRRVERGEFARPRSVSPWVDASLEAICLKAMALRPDDRYPSPRALADDVERWIADEAVTAHREPWTRRAVRWARRHRTTVATSASTVLVAAVLLAAVATARAVATRRAEAAAREALAASGRKAVEAEAGSDPAAWGEAIADARRAEGLLESVGGADPELSRRVRATVDELTALRRDRGMVAALDEARLLHAGDKGGRFDVRSKQKAFLEAFRSYGIDVAALDPSESEARIRTSRIRDQLIAVLDEWAYGRPENVPAARLRAIAAAADPDPRGVALRDAIERGDAATLRRLVASGGDRRAWGARLHLVFAVLADKDPTASLPLLNSIRREEPSDFWFNFDLAVAFSAAQPPRLADAVRYYGAAVALRPRSPDVRIHLGLALLDRGDLAEAEAECREAVRLKPDYAEAHSNLGNVQAIRGDLVAAVASQARAIALRPGYAEAHSNLGNALAARGDRAGAMAEHREAVRLGPGLARARVNLGRSLSMAGEKEAAEAEYREAVRLDPDLWQAHLNVGSILYSKGDLDGAVSEFREVIRISPGHAEVHNTLAAALILKGDYAGAVAPARESIRLDPTPEAYVNLGAALTRTGDAAGGAAALRDAARAAIAPKKAAPPMRP